ncbi:MAG TPA: transposase [Gemmataceae bacterium]|nr:transposase [Gemmataceae bacterium]
MLLPPQPKPAKPSFALDVLARLPLADAFYSLWRYLTPEHILQPLYDRQRGCCYQQQLTFTQLVAVVADALTRYHGSGRKAIQDALDQQQLSTQQRAVYGKLSRVPLALAEAFLPELTARLRLLLPPAMVHTVVPASLTDLTVVVVDGKKIKRVAKRLLEVRGRPGKVFGGKLLAAYLPHLGLAVALAADRDGEANDIRLVPRLLPQVRAAVTGPRLWLADRQFCDLEQPQRFAADGDHYLIRFSLKTSFEADPSRPGSTGVDAAGRTFREEWGWMGAASQGVRRCYVRRIWLEREGEEAVVLVTDLWDAALYPATDLLAVYLERWQIETVFQKITEVFELRHLIGCTPQATVFQASLCLVMYNVLQVLRGYAAGSGAEPVPVAKVSMEKLFDDVHEDLVALNEVLQVEEFTVCFEGQPTPEALRERLEKLLGRAWSKDWLKAVSKKARVYKAKAKQAGAHTSVHKILQEARQQKQTKKESQSG